MSFPCSCFRKAMFMAGAMSYHANFYKFDMLGGETIDDFMISLWENYEK